MFDGGCLPAKVEEKNARNAVRARCRLEAEQLWREGKPELAVRKHAEATDVTPRMAHLFLRVLQQRKIQYIVAPYEADAQMAYMYQQRLVSLIVTEDSDLLVFGCDKVFFKLDGEGFGYEINISDLKKVPQLHFRDMDWFVRTCVLSGCDYISSLKGIGFKRACVYTRSAANLDSLLRLVAKESKFPVPPSYRQAFEKAFLTYKFQTVYDPKTKSLVPLSRPEGQMYPEMLRHFDDRSFLGPYLLSV